MNPADRIEKALLPGVEYIGDIAVADIRAVLEALRSQINKERRACKTCGRALDVASDPLSLDCGGDCKGCIDDAEPNEDRQGKN